SSDLTVQVIPHITDEIKDRILRLARDDVDVVITEVGGTVGDIEILPFLEAIRQFRKDVGRDNVCYVHVTLVPFIGPSGEQKTKPTQHSVTELRSRGIQPDGIGLIGKYVNLPDAYLSVVEALRHGGFAHGARVEIEWIQAEEVEGLLTEGRLRELDGIVIPGGFGERGIEGKIAAAGYARE